MKHVTEQWLISIYIKSEREREVRFSASVEETHGM